MCLYSGGIRISVVVQEQERDYVAHFICYVSSTRNALIRLNTGLEVEV